MAAHQPARAVRARGEPPASQQTEGSCRGCKLGSPTPLREGRPFGAAQATAQERRACRIATQCAHPAPRSARSRSVVRSSSARHVRSRGSRTPPFVLQAFAAGRSQRHERDPMGAVDRIADRGAKRHGAGVTARGVEQPRAGRLEMADADLPSLSRGHLVGDSTGPAKRGKQGPSQMPIPQRTLRAPTASILGSLNKGTLIATR
jgi:hypothetical protein